ncbi:FeoB-associated Cys-rich membrane protein [Terrilactibacillus tamarindi]|nr:FeoB-associated Cys-rich membrane protein [Terrilactibacillus tamarindi]
MLFSYIFGILIFGYAAWTISRFIKKSKQGRCATCALQKACEQKPSTCSNVVQIQKNEPQLIRNQHI